MGYKENPKATIETYDKEGFLHTGDLGSIDEQGLVTIHDRIKELIKVSWRIREFIKYRPSSNIPSFPSFRFEEQALPLPN